MKLGTKTILALVAIFTVAILFTIPIPFGPELLLLLLGIGIPGYITYRVVKWIYVSLQAWSKTRTDAAQSAE